MNITHHMNNIFYKNKIKIKCKFIFMLPEIYLIFYFLNFFSEYLIWILSEQ